ncbi:MAG: dienelactone hydrolase family protein [Arachnia sp.]
MKLETLGSSYLAVPDGDGPFPGVVVVHEAFGLNDNIREICRRFADEGYVALGVDVFEGRSRSVCMAQMMAGALAGNLEHKGVPEVKAALTQLSELPAVDEDRIGAVGFCLGGTIIMTWACTDDRLNAIAPFYGVAPRSEEAIRRMCPVVGSWPGKDFTTKSAHKVDVELYAVGTPRDIKVYPEAKHSFFNDQGRNHDPDAAADAWQRVLAFFDEHVKDGKAA